MSQKRTNRVRLIQHGKQLTKLADWRIHRTSLVSGIVGKSVCYSEVTFGSPKDLRCGNKATASDFAGRPVAVEGFNSKGSRVACVGLATSDQAAAHPKCTAVAW